MAWNELIIKDPNFEFEVHVIEPWKTRFYVIRSLFLNIKSRPKIRFVSITYHFLQQNFVQYFCMHLLYLARLVLSWYLNISFIYASHPWTIWSYRYPFRLSNIFHSLLLLLWTLLDWNLNLVLLGYMWV